MLLKEIPPKEIAYNLHISYNTLLDHQKKLYRNLGVSSVQELIAKYPHGTTLIQRTYHKIVLLANRWSNPDDPSHGENWGASLVIPAEEFPPHFSSFSRAFHRYAVTISGTADHDLDYGLIALFGQKDGKLVYLGISTDNGYITIKANVPFAETTYVEINSQNSSLCLNDYSEIVMQITNQINTYIGKRPEINVNNRTIPADIPDGQIMATISNCTITLKDTKTTRKPQDFVSF